MLYFQHHFSSLRCHMIFRNQSNMLIFCSRNISDYYQCWKLNILVDTFSIQDSLMNRKFKRAPFVLIYIFCNNIKVIIASLNSSIHLFLKILPSEYFICTSSLNLGNYRALSATNNSLCILFIANIIAALPFATIAKEKKHCKVSATFPCRKKRKKRKMGNSRHSAVRREDCATFTSIHVKYIAKSFGSPPSNERFDYFSNYQEYKS